MDSRIIMIFLVSCTLAQIAQSREIITTKCFQCMCLAASGCAGPIHGLSEGGRYAITRPYWTAAGSFAARPGILDDITNWVVCVNDEFCSKLTIFNYMNKYARDCNGDGVIDCDDYIRIHEFGPGACNVTTTPIIERYNQCMGVAYSVKNV